MVLGHVLGQLEGVHDCRATGDSGDTVRAGRAGEGGCGQANGGGKCGARRRAKPARGGDGAAAVSAIERSGGYGWLRARNCLACRGRRDKLVVEEGQSAAEDGGVWWVQDVLRLHAALLAGERERVEVGGDRALSAPLSFWQADRGSE
jgi:hypothetical protein